VDDGGYRWRQLWSEDGWSWRESEKAGQPIYWRREGNTWLRRDFDRWLPLEANHPIIHVNWHEANAYCNWAKQRLPSEAEWEAAAAASSSDLSARKRRFPWGDELPDGMKAKTSEAKNPCQPFAQLNGFAPGCCDVAEYAAGDSYFGCRQMIGNVWEWTASAFQPYPGFVADPYRDYSQPWFGTHKVLRGGAWPTRGRLIRNTWRNFYQPQRRDIWAGFRTCALQS
jgi:iron(II)-dependent oxidoreductase